jgi:rhamnose transport system permease protein
MTDTGVAVVAPSSRTRSVGQLLRQREASLVLIMIVFAVVASVAAPQFLSTSNISNVASLASIAAVAAVGQALVVITRSIDLSVEAVIGLVAYVVAVTLEGRSLDAPTAIVVGVGLGLVLGMVNGFIVTVLRVPAIVATLGTLSIFRGIDYLIAGSHQVAVAGLPPGFTDAAYDSILGIPIFVVITVAIVAIGTIALRYMPSGRRLYAVGSNPEAAEILGIPSRRVVFTAYALCGMLAGVAGVMWVVQFGTINGTAATGFVLAVVAAVVVGGVNIFGGSGTLIGAALGAYFLGFVANALILVGLSQFWLQAIYGVVILGAISADAIVRRRLQRTTGRRPA